MDTQQIYRSFATNIYAKNLRKNSRTIKTQALTSLKKIIYSQLAQ